MKWLLSIIVTVVLIGAAGFFYLFSVGRGAEFALEAYLEGDYSRAASALESAHLSPEEDRLYHAYLARALGDLPLSESLLEGALECCESALIEEEIYYGLLLNTLLSGETREVEWWLSKCDPPPLLRAAALHFNGEIAPVAELLMERREELSPWLACALEQHFGQAWRALRVAHALIERGKTDVALERLHRLGQMELTSLERCERSLLLGLVYAEQGRLDLAESAFEGVSPELLEPYLDFFSHKWEESAFDCFLAKQFEECSDLVRRLESWRSVSSLSCRICAALLEEEDPIALALSFRSTLSQGELCEWLARNFESALMEQGGARLELVWSLSRLFCDEPHLLDERVASRLAHRALEVVASDQRSLLGPYIELWKLLEKDPVDRLLFAQRLLRSAHFLWREPEECVRGAEAIRLAYSLPQEGDQSALVEEIEWILRTAFLTAKEGDEISQMRSLDLLAQEFGIELISEEERLALGNLLADTEYYFSSGRFKEAEERAAWVVRLQPENEQAKLLLGLSQFSQDHFEEALSTLSSLETKDRDVEESIGISMLRTGDLEGGRALLGHLKEPSDRVYREMGASWIRSGDPERALEWLAEVNAPFLTLYARLLRGDREGITAAYEALSLPLRHRPDLNALLAHHYMTHGQLARAQAAVELAQSGVGSLPAPDPMLVRARLAIELDRDLESALVWVGQAEGRSCARSCLEGEIAEMAGEVTNAFLHYREASLLARSQQESQEALDAAKRSGEAAGLVEDLAALLIERGEAVPGEILAQMGRWDLVADSSDRIEHTEALVELGRWEEAGEIADRLLDEELLPCQLLRLGSALRARQGEFPRIDAVCNGSHPKEELALQIRRGDSARALELLALLEEEEAPFARAQLAKSPEEQIYFAKRAPGYKAAYLRLSKEGRAELTKRSHRRWQEQPELFGRQMEYCRFALLSDEVEQLPQLVDMITALLEEMPDSPELHFFLGRAHLLSGEGRKAHRCFARAAKLHPGFAAAHRALAESWTALGEQERALEALEKALCYDPCEEE